MNVTEAREAIEQLRGSIYDIAGEAMLEHKEEIIGILIKQHSQEYIDSRGSALRTVVRKYVFDFSNNPSPFKRQLSSESSSPYQFDLKIDGNEYYIESDAMTFGGRLKSDWLTKWNEAEIMDIAPDNEALIYPIIQETFEEKVSEILVLD
jgi:hypothetical protein